MEKIIKNIPKPPASISQAIKSNGFVFVSGQIAVDPESGNLLVENTSVQEQTERVIKNIQMILEAAESSLEKVVKVNVYLANMDDFPQMCEVYEKYFLQKPVRTTVAVQLYKTALVEMDVTAEA